MIGRRLPGYEPPNFGRIKSACAVTGTGWTTVGQYSVRVTVEGTLIPADPSVGLPYDYVDEIYELLSIDWVEDLDDGEEYELESWEFEMVKNEVLRSVWENGDIDFDSEVY